MSDEIIFREDMSVELVKSSASDADVVSVSYTHLTLPTT
jgi:hypothetical protein